MLCVLAVGCGGHGEAVVSGELKVWHPVTLTFTGPETAESADLNPFTDYRLDVTFRGQGKDPWGNVRAGFAASLNINRKDYGLNWNEVLETGGLLVGEEVEIRIDAEGILGD